MSFLVTGMTLDRHLPFVGAGWTHESGHGGARADLSSLSCELAEGRMWDELWGCGHCLRPVHRCLVHLREGWELAWLEAVLEGRTLQGNYSALSFWPGITERQV